ncbi:MAG TPA: hypothetical protein QF361_08725 [Gammaproteobacteria bacterium]|nr:hypothetical protein [Gammaproteobacteria bacterium]
MQWLQVTLGEVRAKERAAHAAADADLRRQQGRAVLEHVVKPALARQGVALRTEGEALVGESDGRALQFTLDLERGELLARDGRDGECLRLPLGAVRVEDVLAAWAQA